MSSEVAKFPQGRAAGFSLTPTSLDEAMKYADIIAKSDVIPSDYKGKPGNVLVAIQMGQEIGLPPLQALQSVSVINGRPCVWGDALIGIARSHPACEYISETFDEKAMVATCRVKRKGGPEEVRTFSMADAERAGLTNKGPWKQYTKRMLQMRARGFAIRDVFPDALRGLAVAEEVRDYPEAARDITPQPEARPALEHYPAEKFETNFPIWKKAIESGRKSAEDVIATVQSCAILTDEQQKQIRACAPQQESEPQAAQGELVE